MSEQIRKTRQAKAKPQAVEETTKTEHDQKLKDDLDDLLDDIDEVLEENAEAFVREFTQKSGE